jgi:sugar fermentation stimulation protein A
LTEPKKFKNIHRAFFLNRPNRFIVECLLNNKKIRAYLPNPGRLWELLFPGAVVYLDKTVSVYEKQTRYTCVAVEKDSTPVMLHTHHTNTVAHKLLEQGRIPGLEGYKVVRAEVPFENSRFDFLLEKTGKPLILEVKSCTLFGEGISMFPDAVTPRGEKHLEELALLSRKGTKGGILFLVHWPFAHYFMPEYHTDLAFSQSLYKNRNNIFIKAVSVQWKKDMTIGNSTRELEIPWTLLGEEARDRGSYIVILKMKKPRKFPIGERGETQFKKGYYLYVGSARKNLEQRINRHRRLRKNFFWHIDYLREQADFITALPIRTGDRIECEIADALRGISAWSVVGFGASDCSCSTHLFGMNNNPITSPQFISMLLYFRIDRLNSQLKSDLPVSE